MTEDHVAIGSIPHDWRDALGPAASPDALAPISAFVAAARRSGTVLPCPGRVFAALEATPYASVRAVILGQDPYPTSGYAVGLAFSVPDDLRPLPRSLRTIRAEWQADLGLPLPEGGSLEPWARHGVLLLNTDLTVREGEPGSHRGRWKALTDAIIASVVARDDPVAFLLWGRRAQAKAGLIVDGPHIILHAAHPASRLARGFRGSRPFSTANEALRRRGGQPIDWRLVS